MPSTRTSPIICALDRPDLAGALSLGTSIAGTAGGLKLGLEFLYAQGPAGVRQVGEIGLPIFLDAKLHDIPNTVAGAMRGIVQLPAAMVTVMASGGSAMLRAAVEVSKASEQRPWVLAVTVLTSLDDADLQATGVGGSTTDQALRLADLALNAGCDGLICSPLEVAAIRECFGAHPKIVVPGVRPAPPRGDGAEGGQARDDQKRTLTPSEALAAGADYLVIGRPITAATAPGEAARSILDGLDRAA